MDEIFVERMKARLTAMRNVAEMAHDPRIIEIVTATADQLEEDIRQLEAQAIQKRQGISPEPGSRGRA